MSKNLVSFLIVAVFLTGCQGNVKSTQKSQPEPETNATQASVSLEPSSQAGRFDTAGESASTKSTPPPKKAKIPTPFEQVTQGLIEKGEMALNGKRLLTPADDNANMYFQAALGRDPGNFKAIQGIAAIVDAYTQWAWEAARRGQYKQAERYLDSARSVNPEDPTIVEMMSRVGDLKTKRAQAAQALKERAEQKGIVSKESEQQDPEQNEAPALNPNQFLLPQTLFSLSDDEIIAKIQPIIDKVAQTDQPLAIYWPNDKEARLIYQIINSRVPEFRVRAMIYHRADYMVELQQD